MGSCLTPERSLEEFYLKVYLVDDRKDSAMFALWTVPFYWGNSGNSEAHGAPQMNE